MRTLMILCCALWTCPADAAGLIVQASDKAGRPIADAIVIIRAVGRPTPAPRMGSGYTVSQRNIHFEPFVSIVPVGADVAFPNLDTVRHHVYSFSAAKMFELKLYARDQTRSVHFDKAGVVALGCNIHDSMSAFIYVTDSNWTARTDNQGQATLALPPGTYTMTVWHPYLRAPGNQLQRPIEISAADRREAVQLDMRPPPLRDMSAY